MRPRIGDVGRLLVLAVFTAGLSLSARGAEPAVVFNRDIRPILSDACYHCHGPDKAKRKAGLRLDNEAGAFADLRGHKIIVPGNPDKSEDEDSPDEEEWEEQEGRGADKQAAVDPDTEEGQPGPSEA